MKSGPFSSVRRGEGWDEESDARWPSPASLREATSPSFAGRGAKVPINRVGSRRALLGADRRGRVWEPAQGSHYDVQRFLSLEILWMSCKRCFACFARGDLG